MVARAAARTGAGVLALVAGQAYGAAPEVKFFVPTAAADGELVCAPTGPTAAALSYDTSATTLALVNLEELGRGQQTYSSARLVLNITVGPITQFGTVGLGTATGSFSISNVAQPPAVGVLTGVFLNAPVTFVGNVGTLSATVDQSLAFQAGPALVPLLPAGAVGPAQRATFTITKTSGTLYQGQTLGAFRGEVVLDAVSYFTYSCWADLNDDGLVDDVDFVLFAQAYDRYVCDELCRADADATGFVDDVDFVLFAQAYDRFVCE